NACSVLDPPPLHPQIATRVESRYGRERTSARTASACSREESAPILPYTTLRHARPLGAGVPRLSTLATTYPWSASMRCHSCLPPHESSTVWPAGSP